MREVNLSGSEPGRNYLMWNFVTERTIANARDAMHELQVHEVPCDAAQDWSQLGTILAHWLARLGPFRAWREGCRYNPWPGPAAPRSSCEHGAEESMFFSMNSRAFGLGCLVS